MLLIASSAEFLGYLFLIVYVGAIAILFLFVIMLLNVRQLTRGLLLALPRKFHFFELATALAVVGALLHFLYQLLSAVEGVVKGSAATVARPFFFEVNSRFFDIFAFAGELYTDNAALFMLVTLLLLSAMVGAIVLAANSSERGGEGAHKAASPAAAQEENLSFHQSVNNQTLNQTHFRFFEE